MFCPHCGSELQFQEAEICPKCGVRIKDAPKKDTEIDTKTIIISYVVAAIIPLIGFVLSIYFLIKGKILHFIGLLVVSFLFMFFWWGFLSALAG